MRVREKPPLRHLIDLETPGGRHYRWALDEPNPANVPSGLRYSDTMPGGHESCELVLPRDRRVDYADMERLSDLRVQGPGGEPWWEGRLERSPQTSGDQLAISPGAVGNVAYLDDNKNAVFLGIDRELGRWRGPGLLREVALDGWRPHVSGDAVADQVEPGIRFQLDGPFEGSGANGEAYYDAGAGSRVGKLAYESPYTSLISGGVWSFRTFTCDDDQASGFEDIADHGNADTVAYAVRAATTPQRFALIQDSFPATSASDLARYRTVTHLAVIGDHELALVGDATAEGLLASDVVAYVVARWAPTLNIHSDSVQRSSFPVPQLAQLDPTTVSEIVKQASRFEMPDWAVWDGYEFVYHQPGARGRTWRLRTGPSQLEATGQSVERLWESIVVQYQDVDGSTRTVGPPGSGADTESADLKDDDPDNPANKRGVVRRDRLVAGVGTPAGMIELGRRFLEGTKQLDHSGKARVVGWAEDDRGVLHPFSAIRSGDYAVFVDAADTSPRKIVRTDKTLADYTCGLDLDAPPEGLQQLLERLQVVLVRLGFQ